MTVSLFLFLYIPAVIFVVYFEPFGPIQLGIPSVIGSLLFGLFFIFLFFPFRERAWQFKVTKPGRIEIVSFVLSGFILVWLIYIVNKYGYSAFLFYLRGEPVPDRVLHGAYREQLPLRAFFPPLTLALCVSVILFRKKDFWGMLSIVLTLFTAVFFIGIYETRHIIIWAFFYFLFYYYAYVTSLFTSAKKMRLTAVVILASALFILLGNIRSGVSGADARRFAIAMAIDEKYADLPMPLIWGLIYFFSGVARGVVNDEMVGYFNADLPQKLVPGVLQPYIPDGTVKLNKRFSDQMFAIDAWHTYALEFGIIGGFVLLTAILSSFLGLIFHFDKRLSAGRVVPGWYYAFLIWFSVRISLLVIGDYFLDFAAFVELFFCIFFFQLVGLKLVPNNGMYA